MKKCCQLIADKAIDYLFYNRNYDLEAFGKHLTNSDKHVRLIDERETLFETEKRLKEIYRKRETDIFEKWDKDLKRQVKEIFKEIRYTRPYVLSEKEFIKKMDSLEKKFLEEKDISFEQDTAKVEK